MLPAMIRRLLLALLVACLALPAAAAPLHCAQVAETHDSGHHSTKPEAPPQAPPAHDCIGCIAPFSGAAPALASAWYAPSPVVIRGPLPLARLSSGPDTPPPKA